MAEFLLISHCLGVLSSLHALMGTRTSQGAIAWIVSLNTFPYVSVPLYWVLGRTKFRGYVSTRQELHELAGETIEDIRRRAQPFILEPSVQGSGVTVGSRLAELPYLRGNAVELLIDGEATFASILAGIREATEYVLVQFYIVRDDGLGRELKDLLISKAAEGVKIWFLYDEIGTRGIESYLAELERGGVRVRSFHTTRGARNRFQVNFRNHRKIVVVDGQVGWVGGHNVGDEYLGKDLKLPNWRDTHMKITGPAVLELQLPFLEDWQWATDEVLNLTWDPVQAEGKDAIVLVLPTGPADRLESCSLMFQQAIHSARDRIWIASPYFVPDGGLLSSLHLAALRGVDVRVIIPDVPDKKLVYYSAFAFIGPLLESDIQIHRYEAGFMHQKVFLVDDVVAGVGTANFDNRSFRLNFEVTALVGEEQFLHDIEQMFEADFARSRRMTLEEIEAKGWWFNLMSRGAYLTAPVL